MNIVEFAKLAALAEDIAIRNLALQNDLSAGLERLNDCLAAMRAMMNENIDPPTKPTPNSQQ